jgi:hypothetical protein
MSINTFLVILVGLACLMLASIALIYGLFAYAQAVDELQAWRRCQTIIQERRGVRQTADGPAYRYLLVSLDSGQTWYAVQEAQETRTILGEAEQVYPGIIERDAQERQRSRAIRANRVAWLRWLSAGTPVPAQTIYGGEVPPEALALVRDGREANGRDDDLTDTP